jgi:diadenosine tetraphosphate (Ap4A) HIT family hydrolase
MIGGMTDRFLAHLPVGGASTPFDGSGIPGWDTFPFEGDLRVRALEPPVLPEPPRDGEDGPEDCSMCRNGLDKAIWHDEHWLVRHLGGPSAAPVVLLLCPIGHYDLIDLPPARAAEIGPMLQRVERAVMALGGVGRVHASKIGDGAKHLHLWVFARPAGLEQLRGSCLVLWDDVLPRQDETQWRAVLAEVAAALAVDGGTDLTAAG